LSLRPRLALLRLPMAPLLAAAALTAVALPPGQARSPGDASSRAVSYDGVSVRVPASWPVYNLASDPTRCVRLDVHAVYLGTPGPRQNCPAHLVGRSEAVVISSQAGDTSGAPLATRGELTRGLRGGHVHVTATFGSDEHLATQIAESATTDSSSTTSPTVSPAAYVTTPTAAPQAAPARPGVFIGNAFDTCSAPSLDVMRAWIRSSPYRAANIYIGGAARACGDGNLSAGWVSSVRSLGWRLIPTYVGLQAPCTSFSQLMSGDPATATTQGTQAADDAVQRAQFFGLPANTPVYDDIENYDTTAPGCSAAVLAFLSGWTQELHAKGYTSGAYGSGASLVRDLVTQAGTGYQEPDDLWFADWNNLDSIYGDPYVPDTMWTQHQRIHQWHGGRSESYGGFAVNLDGDATDGAVVGPPGGTCVHYPVDTYGPDGCGGGVTYQGPMQYWRLGSPNGLLGSMRWTYGNGTSETNGATWQPQLRAGSYHVSAYIPAVDASATVSYVVTDATGAHPVRVDQSAHPSTWVSLGTYATAPSTGITVHVGDATSTSATVGVDAMRFVRVADPVADFNDDGRSDITVFRPGTGVWWIHGVTQVRWGQRGDVPVPGDFNGDGRADLAVWRPSTGEWWLHGIGKFQWGQAGDVPLVGDFNGDGRSDAAIWRPSTGEWYLRGIGKFQWGQRGDIPVVGDFDGDGRSDVAVFRPSNGTWYIRGIARIQWGQRGDIPVVGDFNGDGVSDLTVFRPSTGTWWIRGITRVQWGQRGDIPISGDFDGDGRTDLTVYRPSTGIWYVHGVTRTRFGDPGDIPV